MQNAKWESIRFSFRISRPFILNISHVFLYWRTTVVRHLKKKTFHIQYNRNNLHKRFFLKISFIVFTVYTLCTHIETVNEVFHTLHSTIFPLLFYRIVHNEIMNHYSEATFFWWMSVSICATNFPLRNQK